MKSGKINTAILKRIDLFATASDETLEWLSHRMKIVSFSKGTFVFHDKEVLEQVYIVFSGKFSIYKVSDTSDKRVIFILGVGNLLNDHLSHDLPSAIWCESFEDAAALVISKQQFLKIMSQDFNLTQAVIGQFSNKLRRTYRQLKNAPTNVAIEKKIAAKLYALSRDYGMDVEGGVLIDVTLTVTNLSEMLGAQRETISRSLQKLMKEELIIYENKKILIPNLDALVYFYKKRKTSQKN